MKWKVSNTLFVLSAFLFVLAILFNYAQVKKSVETSLEKARRVKKEKANERKEEAKKQAERVSADIDAEFEEIINSNKNGEK